MEASELERLTEEARAWLFERFAGGQVHFILVTVDAARDGQIDLPTGDVAVRSGMASSFRDPSVAFDLLRSMLRNAPGTVPA